MPVGFLLSQPEVKYVEMVRDPNPLFSHHPHTSIPLPIHSATQLRRNCCCQQLPPAAGGGRGRDTNKTFQSTNLNQTNLHPDQNKNFPSRLEVIASRLQAIPPTPLQVDWRPSLLGWRPSQVGWRPLLGLGLGLWRTDHWPSRRVRLFGQSSDQGTQGSRDYVAWNDFCRKPLLVLAVIVT